MPSAVDRRTGTAAGRRGAHADVAAETGATAGIMGRSEEVARIRRARDR